MGLNPGYLLKSFLLFLENKSGVKLLLNKVFGSLKISQKVMKNYSNKNDAKLYIEKIK